MRKIEKLTKEDLPIYGQIAFNAYPGMSPKIDKITEYLEKSLHNNSLELFGCFESDKLIGAMKLHDFTMNFHGLDMKTAGVGFVSVDLLHKREHVCKNLIKFYLEYFLEKDFSMAALYPFRPDFYKKMGFGYGAQKFKFSLSPLAFHKGKKENLEFLCEDDLLDLLKLYNNIYQEKHGYMKRSETDFENLFKNESIRIIGFKENEELKGYMIFSFSKAHQNNFTINNLELKEMIFVDYHVLKQFSAFLYSQYDQVNRVIFYSQDQEFYHYLADVRNVTRNKIPSVYHETSTAGMGLMYRIIDFTKFIEKLADYNFNNFTGIVKFQIEDSFREDNEGIYYVEFKKGLAKITENKYFSYEIISEISVLSSLFMNSLSFQKAMYYGLIKTENKQLENLFKFKQKPECLTAF